MVKTQSGRDWKPYPHVRFGLRWNLNRCPQRWKAGKETTEPLVKILTGKLWHWLTTHINTRIGKCGIGYFTDLCIAGWRFWGILKYAPLGGFALLTYFNILYLLISLTLLRCELCRLSNVELWCYYHVHCIMFSWTADFLEWSFR